MSNKFLLCNGIAFLTISIIYFIFLLAPTLIPFPLLIIILALAVTLSFVGFNDQITKE
jgi:hypothetical protein